MTVLRKDLRRFILTVSPALMLSTLCLACEVPVFRYALERWAAGQYQIEVASPATLSPTQQMLVRSLREQLHGFADVTVQQNVKAPKDPSSGAKGNQDSPDQPTITGYYPEDSEMVAGQQAFQLDLTETSIAGIAQSPKREELIRHLAAGQSAVWLLLKSGSQMLDEAALKTLQTQLAADAEELTLPSFDEPDLSPEQLSATKIRLRISFEVVVVDPEDPRERCLQQMLLRSEPDLSEAQQPVAFPVFGRGRVLYALVGPGITPENIRTANEFITGPCSCQVKERNPGFDLLLHSQWDKLVGDVLISDPIPETSQAPVLLKIQPGRRKDRRD
ncbi:MAG: hypothetical protein ACKOEO_21445 [Planctomycetaceae bacterium]